VAQPHARERAGPHGAAGPDLERPPRARATERGDRNREVLVGPEHATRGGAAQLASAASNAAPVTVQVGTPSSQLGVTIAVAK